MSIELTFMDEGGVKMRDGQVAVRLSRQIRQESELLDELERHCNALGELVSDFAKDTTRPLDLLSPKDSTEKFLRVAADTNAARKQLQKQIGLNDGFSMRQVIDSLPEPFRSQLNTQRRNLLRRAQTLKANVAADFSIVYHSFEFFRRMIDGLVNRVSEEQCYRPNGKTPSSDQGQFVRKAC